MNLRETQYPKDSSIEEVLELQTAERWWRELEKRRCILVKRQIDRLLNAKEESLSTKATYEALGESSECNKLSGIDSLNNDVTNVTKRNDKC